MRLISLVLCLLIPSCVSVVQRIELNDCRDKNKIELGWLFEYMQCAKQGKKIIKVDGEVYEKQKDE